MAIEKWKLFDLARKRWPLSIHVVPRDGTPNFEAEPGLVAIYEAVEASHQSTGDWTPQDEWQGLANWSFHQALWKLAERSASERDIARDEVTFQMFDEEMRSNLWGDDCWIAERQEYEESPSRFH